MHRKQKVTDIPDKSITVFAKHGTVFENKVEVGTRLGNDADLERWGQEKEKDNWSQQERVKRACKLVDDARMTR